MNSVWDVAIVGYGPAGATLANLLGQYGLSVLVLEREAHAPWAQRARKALAGKGEGPGPGADPQLGPSAGGAMQ